MHRTTQSTIINYVGTQHHVEKYPAHKYALLGVYVFPNQPSFNCQRDYLTVTVCSVCFLHVYQLWSQIPIIESIQLPSPSSNPSLSSKNKSKKQPNQRGGKKKLPADHSGVSNLTGKGESYMTCILWSGWWEAWGCEKGRPKSLTNL